MRHKAGFYEKYIKRLLDIVLSGCALIVLSPLLLVTAILVRVKLGSPVIFCQERPGKDEKIFKLHKFRSMSDARDENGDLLPDEIRLGKFGRNLRATSLDELPELWNVLRGEMSLVGPRPHAIGMKTGETESARLVADYAHRHRIKPGMTGWAAIKGSRGPLHTADEVRDRVQLDIEYIERQSFWLDLWIIAVTVPVLLGDRMAVR